MTPPMMAIGDRRCRLERSLALGSGYSSAVNDVSRRGEGPDAGQISYSAARVLFWRLSLRSAFFFSAGLLSLGAMAAPDDVATLDRSTWPEKLSSPTLFDVASRAEILMFARSLLASEALDEAALKQRLGLRIINLDAIDALRQRLWQRLLENYTFAQQSCDQDASFCYLVEDMDTLREQAGKFHLGDDSFYIRWAEPSRQFHEQLPGRTVAQGRVVPADQQ